MKFGYSYKTSDGVRHESVFEAKTKEDVFASLRLQGVKPIKVWPIYSRFHIKKSTLIITSLAAALGISLIFLARETAKEKGVVAPEFAPRHQIYGDPALLEELESNSYASIFQSVGDRFLAAFAIPGKQVGRAGLMPVSDVKPYLEKEIENNLETSPNDTQEVRELKLIINGMKQELRMYLSDGVGTIETYISRLRERQAEEIHIYERIKTELENERDPKIWKQRNAALRAMGLRTISRPRVSPGR